MYARALVTNTEYLLLYERVSVCLSACVSVSLCLYKCTYRRAHTAVAAQWIYMPLTRTHTLATPATQCIYNTCDARAPPRVTYIELSGCCWQCVYIVSSMEWKHKAKHILQTWGTDIIAGVQWCMYKAMRMWLLVLKTEGLLLTRYDTILMTLYQYKSNNVCIQIQQWMHADTTLYEYRYNSVWTQIQHYMNVSTTILEHKYNKKKIHMQLKYKPRFSDSRIHVCRWWAHAAAGDEYRVATAVRACRSGAARCLSI